MRLLYLHGFLSSPQSHKATLTRKWLAEHAPQVEMICPQLPVEPDRAIEMALGLAEGDDTVGVIGSSLGGFYAMHLSVRLGLPAVLINPAVRPWLLLEDYLGEHEHPYLHQRFTVDRSYLGVLESLSVEPELDRSRLFLLQQTGDETLDYWEAVEVCMPCRGWLEGGGSHEFDRFERVLPTISAFLNLT
ncbi:MAG: esterase YqiA [Gammaproteobacteria bacterium]|nr:MAG: esterase YqiA [Gammaproteobacteria bacterium]